MNSNEGSNSRIDLLKATSPFHFESSEVQASQDIDSAVHVGFVARSQHFSDETTELLRRRLFYAAAVMASILLAAFIGNFLAGISTLWWLRGSVLISICFCVVVLQRYRFSRMRLRGIELVVFFATGTQMTAMLCTRILSLSADGDAASVASVRHQFLGAWCILIFNYGVFIPNHWRRALAVMLPLSLMPFLAIGCLKAFSPTVAEMMTLDHAGAALPFPIVAAIMATYGSHVLNNARRAVFKARQFGQYRLLDRLGQGGMGEVYRAEHILLKRPCAIKLIRADSEENSMAIERFEKEVKATAKLTHWNTIEIFDYGRTDDGTFYYVMELLPGMSLEEMVLKHGRLKPARAVHLLRQVCGALHEAHSMGLIHRDIKPANIFAAQRGGIWDVAKLLDFGLVKETAPEVTTESTQGMSRSFSGTPMYMAPEQAFYYEEVDARADIYSLATTAYFLLTGKAPFEGNTISRLLAAHRKEQPKPPSELNPEIPSDLESIILKCLQKQPSDRYSSIVELESALANCSVAGHWTNHDAASWWKALELPAEQLSATDLQMVPIIVQPPKTSANLLSNSSVQTVV